MQFCGLQWDVCPSACKCSYCPCRIQPPANMIGFSHSHRINVMLAPRLSFFLLRNVVPHSFWGPLLVHILF